MRAKGAAIQRVTLHVGAGTFLPVKADDTADHRMHAEWGVISPRPPRSAERRARQRRPHHRRRHHLAAAAGERRRRGRHDPAVQRRHLDLHHAGLPLSRRRRADDEFPPAALDAVHAGLGLLRSGHDEGGVRARDRETATASIPTATRVCCSGREPHQRRPAKAGTSMPSVELLAASALIPPSQRDARELYAISCASFLGAPRPAADTPRSGPRSAPRPSAAGRRRRTSRSNGRTDR